jgi:PAS domain S-box-containing protein
MKPRKSETRKKSETGKTETSKKPDPRKATTSTNELASLVEALEDYALFLLSPEGIIRSWNRGAARLLGYTADEVLGNHFSLFYTEEDMATNKPGRELQIAASEGRVEDEGWRVRKNGQRFWVNTIISPLFNPDGTLRGFAKVTRDLTERRQAEEQLRRSEEMLSLLVGSVQDYAIFMLDPQGYVESWNAGAQRIKGYRPEEIIGQHFSKFYTPEDVEANKPERKLEIAKEKGSVEDEGWRVRKDGSRFLANVVITAVHDSHGTLRGFAKVTRDITERKSKEEAHRLLLEQREARLAAEEERRRAEESYRIAQESSRAKDEFLMTLSHELRTPMTAILGWARLLPNMSRDDAMFREAIASIGRGAQLQARLIDDVLDVSRIVSGKMRLARDPVDITVLLNDSLASVKPSADAKQITITTSFAPDLGSIVADSTRLQQVLWNLLTNAVKFTPSKGKVEIAARRTSSHLQISVTDSGEGIAPDFLPHIFEAFRQAENPMSRIHGGLGLGLSIVRYIVEAHGGTIAAESKGKGQGATFTATLPIGSTMGSTLTTTLPDRALHARKLADVKILVVDDDPEGREMVRVALRQAGAEVTVVESAHRALAEMEERRPHLIISDISMPHMNGYALAREIRANPLNEDIKLLALTAFPASGSAAERGFFERYLTKPIDPFELVDAVAEVARPTSKIR